MGQPIIRGIQSVGAVDIYYKYNGGDLVLNTSVMRLAGLTETANATIKTGDENGGLGVKCSGFRLDSNFLRANPQIASSFMIPILGGGAVALTNNNRSGVLSIATTRVSTPSPAEESEATESTITVGAGDSSFTLNAVSNGVGSMLTQTGTGLGVVNNEKVFDLTLLLQAQQSQAGGDSVGSTITIVFAFNGLKTIVQFQGCTVANIDPLGLSGNDAVDYNASINYLNWTANYSDKNDIPVAS